MDLPISYSNPERAWAQLGEEYMAILAEKERCYRAGMGAESANHFVSVKLMFWRIKAQKVVNIERLLTA